MRNSFQPALILTIAVSAGLISCKPRGSAALSSEASPPVRSTEELKQLILTFAPEFGGAEDFFERLDGDASQRAAYNALIEQDPHLAKAQSRDLPLGSSILTILGKTSPTKASTYTFSPSATLTNLCND